MEISVLLPFVPSTTAQVDAAAKVLRHCAISRVWQGESTRLETYQHLAAVLPHIGQVGIAVSLMPLRHPFQAAAQARSLAAQTTSPVDIAYGPGSVALQRALLGETYRSPLGTSRSYLTSVRRFLDDTSAGGSGLAHLTHAPVRLGLGVLRPGMAAVAGEFADFAVSWMTPPAYLEDTIRPALRSVNTSSRTRLVTVVPTVLAATGRDLVELIVAGSRAHLQAPHYRDMLRRGGVALGDDLHAIAGGLIAAGGCLAGSMADIQDGIAAYERVGVDELVLNVTGVAGALGVPAGLKDLIEITHHAAAGSTTCPPLEAS
ncbi:LLM class flavin-dependent oxidoreductase [Luteipulveratus mongoliensis]|uniref:Luciferase-like domain-containing protein n=1 Tax=Luteipulveratus mongoliensis TaxID=571913 RepID=A0A0K1JE32_9MICO|nr:LLM class flavin-dependent oxidoreductase [Luteipulveratus mongoliensis]AKU14964.1 hypothetical protein VV02_02250 [Luteipulveratus mongoliensis]